MSDSRGLKLFRPQYVLNDIRWEVFARGNNYLGSLLCLVITAVHLLFTITVSTGR